MSKTTITLFDFIQAEFIKQGHEEFFDYEDFNNKEKDFGMKFNDERNSFMYKILNYDEDTQDVINNRIFRGLKLKSTQQDRMYKQMFLMKYLNHQIGFQTIEEFTSQVMFLFMTHKEYLDYYYEHYIDMLQQKNQGSSSTTSTNEGSSISTDEGDSGYSARSANVTLPQNQPFVDLESSYVDYADDTRADFSKNNKSSTTETENKSDSENSGETLNVRFSLDELNKTRNIMKRYIEEYQKPCFMLVW